jgi:hypothetical protein
MMKGTPMRLPDSDYHAAFERTFTEDAKRVLGTVGAHLAEKHVTPQEVDNVRTRIIKAMDDRTSGFIGFAAIASLVAEHMSEGLLRMDAGDAKSDPLAPEMPIPKEMRMVLTPTALRFLSVMAEVEHTPMIVDPKVQALLMKAVRGEGQRIFSGMLQAALFMSNGIAELMEGMIKKTGEEFES